MFISATLPTKTCGSRLRATVVRKFITSPNYPNKYPPNSYCLWDIHGPATSTLVLEFESFQTQSKKDVLRVSNNLFIRSKQHRNYVSLVSHGIKLPSVYHFRMRINTLSVLNRVFARAVFREWLLRELAVVILTHWSKLKICVNCFPKNRTTHCQFGIESGVSNFQSPTQCSTN